MAPQEQMVVVYDRRKAGVNLGSKVYTTVYEGYESQRQLNRCRERHPDGNCRVVSALADAKQRYG